MSEHNDQSPPKQPEPKRDAMSASTALALAVTSAEKSSGKHGKRARERLAAGLQSVQSLAYAVAHRHGVHAAGIAAAIALGWVGGSQALSGARPVLQGLPAWAEGATASIRQNQDDTVRVAADVQALKGTLESFRASFEQAKIEAAGHNRTYLERLETLERTSHGTTATIVHAAQASDRTERAGAAAEAKLTAIAGRLDAIERQAAVKPAPAAADPAETGSVPDAKAAKHLPLQGWVLREVFGGGAVVEGRAGRLYEVTPGRNLPSVGRVEAIERRGRIWVVVTAKGIIAPPQRWQ